MNEISVDELSAGRFTALVRTRFHVEVEPGVVVDLELTSVSTPQTGGSPGAECFALLFSGPADCPLAQRTYRFSHDQLGAFALFIVPVGAGRGARRYEAVFNRHMPPLNS